MNSSRQAESAVAGATSNIKVNQLNSEKNVPEKNNSVLALAIEIQICRPRIE